MARVRFKKKCSRCREKYVLATYQNTYIECYDCQKKELNKPIEEPEMKAFFNIPEDFYKQNAFLRSIKINYHRFKNLTDRQKEAFVKTVEELKAARKEQEQR